MTTAERLASLERLTAEIHLAVVGDGSAGSSLRERVSALETSNGWRQRALYSVLPSIATAALAQFGLHLPHTGAGS